MSFGRPADMARELLRSMVRDPRDWPDDHMVVDLVQQGLVERRDLAWHLTAAGEQFLGFRVCGRAIA